MQFEPARPRVRPAGKGALAEVQQRGGDRMVGDLCTTVHDHLPELVPKPVVLGDTGRGHGIALEIVDDEEQGVPVHHELPVVTRARGAGIRHDPAIAHSVEPAQCVSTAKKSKTTRPVPRVTLQLGTQRMLPRPERQRDRHLPGRHFNLLPCTFR